MDSIEEWKTISGFENYKISNLGRVKSLERKVRKRNGNRIIKETILKLAPANGYSCVSFYTGKKKTFLVHRLVGAAFLGLNLNNSKQQIDHKNRIRSDNRLDNLRIVNHRGNGQNRTDQNENIGVSVKGSKFSAGITISGKRCHLGTYDSVNQAEEAYLTAIKNLDKFENANQFRELVGRNRRFRKNYGFHKATGKFRVRFGQKIYGYFDTEEDAKNKVLEVKTTLNII